jgi:hypothetical protein
MYHKETRLSSFFTRLNKGDSRITLLNVGARQYDAVRFTLDKELVSLSVYLLDESMEITYTGSVGGEQEFVEIISMMRLSAR